MVSSPESTRVSNELKDQEQRTSHLLALNKAHLSLEVPLAVSFSVFQLISISITEALLLKLNSITCFSKPFSIVDTTMLKYGHTIRRKLNKP